MWLAVFAAALLLLFWRAYESLPKKGYVWKPPKDGKARLLVVLGSGGHTTEMFYDLSTLPNWSSRWQATYLLAATDTKSQVPAEEFEKERGGTAAFIRVPRAREVGQSYSTSVYTTLVALVASVRAVFSVMPDVVVCNGPGTCVPVCMAAYICRVFGFKRIALIYSESLACVDHLSVSGRLLLRFVDRFTVQWDPVHARYPQALHAGRCRGGEATPQLPRAEQKGSGVAVVTVGSTKFEDLIRAADRPQTLSSLAALGVTRLVVQKGNGRYVPQVITDAEVQKQYGVAVEVIEYSSALPAQLREASLVVSHAGAGTVLDCLLHCRRMIVVPNEALMQNHQEQLAKELCRYGLLRWCKVGGLSETINGYTGEELHKFPSKPTSVFAEAMREISGR